MGWRFPSLQVMPLHSSKCPVGREIGEEQGDLSTLDMEVSSHGPFPHHHPRQRTESDLVGLVDIIVGQGAQKMLQAWDIVIINGMDDGLHHKRIFLILGERTDRVGLLARTLLAA